MGLQDRAGQGGCQEDVGGLLRAQSLWGAAASPGACTATGDGLQGAQALETLWGPGWHLSPCRGLPRPGRWVQPWQQHQGLGNAQGLGRAVPAPGGGGDRQLAGLAHHSTLCCTYPWQMWGKPWGRPPHCAPPVAGMRVSPGPCSRVLFTLDTWQRCPIPLDPAGCQDSPVCDRGVGQCSGDVRTGHPWDAASRGGAVPGPIAQPQACPPAPPISPPEVPPVSLDRRGHAQPLARPGPARLLFPAQSPPTASPQPGKTQLQLLPCFPTNSKRPLSASSPSQPCCRWELEPGTARDCPHPGGAAQPPSHCSASAP